MPGEVTEPVAAVTVRAPGKVNLALAVGRLRADGYHEVVSVLHAVSLSDEVVAEPGPGVSVSVAGEGADAVPTGRDNLAARAAYALARFLRREPAVHLTLRKAIPVAGGMAGGSADAAAALLACSVLWDARLSREHLLDLAAGLGSDVPFGVLGGTAVATGRGERLAPALSRGTFHWVLALADGGLSTPGVYGQLDRLRGGSDVPAPRVPPALMAALRSGDAAALGRALGNDLQDAALALRPALRLTLEAGADAGALAGVVAGSGPTCAFLARDERHATDVAARLSAAGVCRTLRRAYGPVSGARVVASGP